MTVWKVFAESVVLIMDLIIQLGIQLEKLLSISVFVAEFNLDI